MRSTDRKREPPDILSYCESDLGHNGHNAGFRHSARGGAGGKSLKLSEEEVNSSVSLTFELVYLSRD